jgi:peptidyl-prolyl cis-trans isomerase SurA
VLDVLINERVQVTNARETGQRLDDAELDRAVLNVAVQNQMTLPQLRARLQQQGLAYTAFRNNLRDQMLMERVREREVNARIRIGNGWHPAQHRADPGDRARRREPGRGEPAPGPR